MQFEHAILATGSTPAIPAALKVDDPRVMDSTAALDLPDIPQSLLVVGGGYIGLELGTVYATLGSAVTVVEMTPGLLPGADRDLVDILAKRVTQTMKSVLLETRVVQMKADGRGIRRHDGREGRPEGADLRSRAGRGRAPAELEDSRASIARACRSTTAASSWSTSSAAPHEPSIFAIGDVVGEPMLAHKASHEGRVAVEVIAGENVGVRAARDSRRRLHRSRAGVGGSDRGAGGEGEPEGRRSRSFPGARRAAPSRSIAPTA